MVSDLDILCVYIPVGILMWSGALLAVTAACEICATMGKNNA